MTCMSRRAPSAPGRFVAIERSPARRGDGDRILCRDGRFGDAIGGPSGMQIFAGPDLAAGAACTAPNRRPGTVIDIQPLRGPVAVAGTSLIGHAVGAVVIGIAAAALLQIA